MSAQKYSNNATALHGPTFALTKISLVASIEVLIRVAILYEFARYSSYKANDDLPYSSRALELG